MIMSGINKIKKLREERKMSRKELADKLQISYWALSKYENNERTPDITLLRKIAQEFGVSIEYLAGLSDENLLLSTSPVIQKILQLPPEALNEIDLFVDFLNYKYKLKAK